MDCATAIFSIEEIEAFLRPLGLKRGTLEFTEEVGRRFRQSDTDASKYVEREDWKGPLQKRFDQVLDGVDLATGESHIALVRAQQDSNRFDVV